MSDGITRIPAKAGDASRWGVTLYHNVCGCRLSSRYNGTFQCDGPCRVEWKPRVMQAFTDADMATRFHKRIEPDAGTYTIVWRTDEFSKTRYSTCIPLSEVRPTDERFTL